MGNDTGFYSCVKFGIKIFLHQFDISDFIKILIYMNFEIRMTFLDRTIITLHNDINFIKIEQFKEKLLASSLPLPQLKNVPFLAGLLQIGISNIVRMTLLLDNI